jgi:hypothetical protein
MPTANRDASRVTQRKRAVALYTWNAANKTAVNAGQSVRREQPDTQLGEVLAQRNTTKAFIGNSCPCSADVLVSPSGGNNSNNVQ